MTTTADNARACAREHGGRFVDELLEMLRIPSVGADPAFAADTRRNAEWLVAHLASLGLDNARVLETAGHPVAYGEWLGAGPDKRTVLIYGHYDVVPAAMEDGWDTPPFEPVIKDDKIYALIKKAIEDATPPTVKVEVRLLTTGKPALIPFDLPEMQTAARAYERGWGHAPVFTRGGGSIPIVAELADLLNIPVVMMGYGLDTDGLHSPNEHYRIDMFHRGIQTAIVYLDELAQLPA